MRRVMARSGWMAGRMISRRLCSAYTGLVCIRVLCGHLFWLSHLKEQIGNAAEHPSTTTIYLCRLSARGRCSRSITPLLREVVLH